MSYGKSRSAGSMEPKVHKLLKGEGVIFAKMILSSVNSHSRESDLDRNLALCHLNGFL